VSPASVLVVARNLSRDETGETARDVNAWIRRASPRAIVELAAVARASFSQSVGEPPFAASDPAVVTGVASLLSTGRNGYVREEAVKQLASTFDPVVIPFLLLRTDDIVPTIRALADEAIVARLRSVLAPAFATSLGIVELLRGRTRGGGGRIVQLVQRFLSEPECREALWSASSDEDPAVRQAALGLLLRVAPPVDVLGRALHDDDARVRFWGGRAAMSKATSDDEKRALLPSLERSRSAWMRARALRARAHLDASDTRLEAALLDHHTHVRYLARTLLRARHPTREFGETRHAALAVLARAATAPELIGALGALADVGVAADLAAVQRFESDPRPRVRAEARRTRDLLGH
jgi:hypothetical protein